MCEYCEYGKRIYLDHENKEYFFQIYSKNINILNKPLFAILSSKLVNSTIFLSNRFQKSTVFSLSFFINYCPFCGERLIDYENFSIYDNIYIKSIAYQASLNGYCYVSSSNYLEVICNSYLSDYSSVAQTNEHIKFDLEIPIKYNPISGEKLIL